MAEQLRDKDEIREAVRESYAAAARSASGGSASSCGPEGCGCGETVLREEERAVFGAQLYEDGERASLPDAAKLASLGCGNPTAVAELHEGETVLDLGSGGGIDVLLSARRVGSAGKAYGLDMTDEMLELARANQRQMGVENAEFLKGTIEAVPLPDKSVDVIISNCVVNLSADKPAVFRESARVLRPGGRLAITDIVADPEMDEATRRDMQRWTGCIAGALTEADFKSGLQAAGLEAIEVAETHRVHEHAGSAIVRARKPSSDEPVEPHTDPSAIAECALDLGGLRDQRDRYRALGHSVRSIDRGRGALEIRFAPDLDVSLLEKTLAVERECCPFFVFDHEPDARRLTVSVERADQEPALTAIADALTG